MNLVKRGSKYIHRQKMSIKHFEIQLQKFKFSKLQIRKIVSFKKKFKKVFEEEIKEMISNPKPAQISDGKHPDFFCEPIFQREMAKVKSLCLNPKSESPSV